MFILSSKCLKAVLIALILRIVITTQVESALSSSNLAKIQRAQTIRRPSFNPELIPKTRPVSMTSASSSSSSSSSQLYTVSHQSESGSKALARASTSSNLPEATRAQPLLEESLNIPAGGSSRLIDPLAVTHNVHVDTARDGVLVRTRNRMLQYGSLAAIGVGGGFATKELLNQYYNNNNNNLTKPINATQNLNNQTNSVDDDDDLSNPF